MASKRKLSGDHVGSASLTVVETISSSSHAPPPLKLRIKHQTIAQRLIIDIYEAKNTKVKLRNLLAFSRQLRLTQISVEESEQLLRLFKDLVKKESDYSLRAKSVELMGEVCRVPGGNKLQIVEEILDSLHKESMS